jgi:hypothetical protein
MIKVTTQKNSEGYINCYIELKEFNDFPGVRGAISNDFINQVLVSFEENFGVSVNSYPTKTRIELINIINKDSEITKAQRIIQTIAELINANLSRPSTSSDELAKESQDMQYLRSIGGYCKNSRNTSDQEKVDQSFKILKEKGASPWELDVNFFLIRDLKRGFFKENHERVLGIDELLIFSRKYFPK